MNTHFRRRSLSLSSLWRDDLQARRPLVEALEQRIAPAAFGWAGAVSGNWNTASNWSLVSGSDADGIPDADDTVVINPAGVQTITISSAVAAVSISMPGDDHLVITGGLTLTSASSLANLDLSGTLTTNGGATITGTSTISGDANLAGT